MKEFAILIGGFSELFVPGLVVATLTLIIVDRISKHFEITTTLNILRFILATFGTLTLIFFLIQIFQNQTEGETISTYIGRANGIYWIGYLFMIISNTILPILLLFKKLGLNKYIVLVTTILMNSGRIIEWIILQSVAYHRKYAHFDFGLNKIGSAIGKGLVIATILILIGMAYKKMVVKNNA
jgi:hypothetical protein